MKSKRVTIKAAKEISKQFDKDQVIIITHDSKNNINTVTTYGRTIGHCENAAIAGNAYKKALGFPPEKCNDLPSRIKKKISKNG